MSNQNLKATISVADALSKSWKSVTSNVWPFVGFTFIYFVSISMLQRIPFISSFTTLVSFIYPVSLFSALQKVDRAGGVSFSDFFSWTPKFVKFLGANFILILIGVVIFLPLIFLLIALVSSISILAIFSDPVSFFQQFVGISAGSLLLLVFLFLIVGVLFLMLNFAFMFLILFNDLSIGDALKLSWAVGVKNIGQLIVFCLLAFGVALLGTLALVVGLLVAVPVIVGMQYYFLKNIFPDNKAEEWDFMKEGGTPGL